MNKTNTLSLRGQKAAVTPLRIDFDLFFEATYNAYHPVDNPDGAFPLNTAENKLSWPILKEKLESIAREKSIPDWVPNYTSYLGHQSFRESAVRFVSKHIAGCAVAPQHLGLSSGATGIIELSTWILAEPGEVAVFPAPCYPVYRQDIGIKADIERYDLLTHNSLKEIFHEPALTIAHLKKGKRDIEKQGKKFKILVITNPDNPTGGLYSIERLQEIAAWCIQEHIHLIVNEIYGLSLINTNHSDIQADYPQQRSFRSFLGVMQKLKSPYLHWWYALSKDFGISGFRVGMVCSFNLLFLQAFENINAPHLISNHTQWLIKEMLEDDAFIDHYIGLNQKNMTDSYALVIQYLKKLKIPYVPSRGSLFIWIDLSEFMDTPIQDGEMEFWKTLYQQTGVLLTPGVGFGHQQ